MARTHTRRGERKMKAAASIAECAAALPIGTDESTALCDMAPLRVEHANKTTTRPMSVKCPT